MEVYYKLILLLLAQYTERGKGILGSGIELGGLFNNVKINVDSYQKVIDDFKKIGDFSKYWEKDKFNWDAIAKAIEGCDETALSYFKTLDDGNGTINNQSASVEGLGTHLKATGQSFNFAAIKATLLNTALNAGIFLVVSLAIQGVVKALDNWIHRVEKLQETAKNAKEELNNLKSESDSLNQELKTTNERITELENKPSLSFIEQEELEKLRDASKELERQIKLNKTLLSVQEGKTRDSALNYLNAKTSYEQYGKWDMSQVENGNSHYGSQNVGELFQGNQLEVAEKQLKEYEDLLSKKEDVENRIMDFKIANPDDTKYTVEQKYALENLQMELQSYDSTLQSLNDSLYETIPNLDSYKDVLNPQYDQSYIDYIDSLVDGYNELFSNSSETITQKFNDIWDSDTFKNTRNELEELAKAGKLDADVLTSNEKYKTLLESTGATAEQVAEHINSLIESEKEIEDISLNSDLSLPDAQKLVNGLKDGETEALGLIDELSLLQEILSDTGNIQQETYAKLLSCSSKYSVAIRTENGRITLNTTKLKQVAKSRQIDTEEVIRQTLALKKQEWIQWNNKIENYNGTLLDSIEIKHDDIDVLQRQITQYELLVNSLDNASSAFERFKATQQTNDQDMYDTAQEAFNILKEYTSDTESKNYGKYNTDEFQEAVMLLMDTDTYRKAVNAKDLEEYQKVISSFVKTLNPLFDEKNYNSAASLFDRIQEIMDSGDIPEADKDWAKRLGISEETFHALSQLGNLYDFNNKEIFEGYQLNTLDNYYEKLQAVKSAKDALNEIEDKDTNAYISQEAELKNLTESYDTFVNDTVQKVSDAYTAFQQSSTGKSFADYLKETLDFDDNDITGSLMTVIDKSGDLQKTLDSISLNEVVQSQQEEYQQLQNLNQIISTLNENGYSSVDVEVKNKSGFDEVYNEYEKLRQKALEYQEAISNSDNPHEINELNGYLSECVSNMEKLREPLRLEIEANIERVNAQLESVKSKINELNNQTSLSPYQQERLGVLKGEQAALENQQATLEARLKVIVDDSEVKDWKAPDDKKMTVTTQIDDSAVTSWTAPEKTMKVRAVVDTSGLTGSLGGLQSGSGTPGTSNTGGASQGGSHAKGTVGNAFANGYNGLPTDEKNALRSEYGQKEMTVYPDGRYEITETPTLSDLPKGTVIFNEKQTNRILKGISHFKGTVGRAFNTGTKINLPNLVDVISNNNAISGANNNSSKPSTTSDSPSHAAREAKEATEEIFDWIERRIKKFQAAFDKWIKQAETAVTSGFINKYYKKATSAIKNELSTYGKAYKRYMKQADSVGLSKKYRDKVKNGTIDIETIKDEKLAEQIKKYQEWCVTYAPLSGNRWRYSI